MQLDILAEFTYSNRAIFLESERTGPHSIRFQPVEAYRRPLLRAVTRREFNDEPTGTFEHLSAEGGTRTAEPFVDPRRLIAVHEARVTELEAQWDDLESGWDGMLEIDREELAKVVARLGVGGVVIDKVTEVVQDAVGHAVEHVGGVAGHERRARGTKRLRRPPDAGDRLADHIRSPVGRHNDDVGVDAADGAEQPARRVAPQIGKGDARPPGRGGIVAEMVGDADARTTPSKDGRSTGRRLVGAGPDPDDPGVGQVSKRVAQRVAAEVQSVVVGERDAVHAKELQHLGRWARARGWDQRPGRAE